MIKSLQNYSQLVASVGREPNSAEFLAWAYLGVAPEWYNEIIKEVK